MRPGPFTVHESDTLGTAHATMKRSRIRHLPVVAGGRIVGMLSERDVLAARAHQTEVDWWSITVHDAMSSPVQTAGPDASLTEIAGRMAASKIGALPIVERGKLLGIATVTDVLAAEVRSAMTPPPASQATAVDAMTAYPFTISPDALLFDAVARMVDHHVRHLPVVDSTATVVGMVSETDVRTTVGDPLAFISDRPRSSVQFRVRDVMSRPAVVVPFDRPLVEVARQFADGKISAVPVVDKFGALLGIVSYVDALRVLAG